MTRTFDLADILSVTTGLVVSPRGVDAFYDLLGYMADEPLSTAALPRVAGECAPELLRQHPFLAEVTAPEEFENEADVWAWLAEQIARYGAKHEVSPLRPDDHTRVDPVAELRMMRPDMPIIAVGGAQ